MTQYEFGWNNIYNRTFMNIKDCKIQNFQYNFLHRNIVTNKFLLKTKLSNSSTCSFCNMEEETIDHLFWNCMEIQHFWNSVFAFINSKNRRNISMNKYYVFFGYKNSAVTYITTLAKYYIYCCKFKQTIPSFTGFKRKLTKSINFEHYIALTQDKLDTFNDMWNIYDFI